MLRQFVKGLLFCVTFITFLLFAYYFSDRHSKSPELRIYSMAGKTPGLIKIGIVGDSWATGKKMDSVINAELNTKGIRNKVYSSGEGGAKSKLIYQNLFADKSIINSSKFVIEGNPDYCIVMVGVNDALQQMGKNYYSHHVRQIIKHLLSEKITPVIVSLPEFGIIETTLDLNYIQRCRNWVASFVNNKGETDNIQTYRNQLASDLKLEQMLDKILMIDFDEVSEDYSKHKDIYLNSAHLNKTGSSILGKVISRQIISDINRVN